MTRLLPTPEAAQRDANAVEIANVWIAERGLHCSLNIGLHAANGRDEERSWGIILADLARHISNALSQEPNGQNPAAHLVRIRDSMLAELSSATSPIAGNFVKPSDADNKN